VKNPYSLGLSPFFPMDVIFDDTNADGVATLEELLPGAGDHKLHAARNTKN